MNLFRTLLLGAIFSQVSRDITAEKDNQISNVTGPNKLPQSAVDSSTNHLSREEINRPQNEQFNVEILEKELSVSLKEAKNEKEAIDSIASILKKFGWTDEHIKDMQRTLESKYEELKNEGPTMLQNYIISFIAGAVFSKAMNVVIETTPGKKLYNAFGADTPGQKQEKAKEEKTSLNNRLDTLEKHDIKDIIAQLHALNQKNVDLENKVNELKTERKSQELFVNKIHNQRSANNNRRSV